MNRKIIVGISQGDGNGIGYEVIIKALADERMLELCTPVVYGSSKLFAFYKKTINDIGQHECHYQYRRCQAQVCQYPELSAGQCLRGARPTHSRVGEMRPKVFGVRGWRY